MSVIKPLVKATGCKPKADEDRQDYLTRLVTAVSEMQEDDWAKLPDDAQDWVNDAITAIKDKKEVVDPAEAVEAEAAAEAPKPAKKPKPAAVKEEAEEAAEEDEKPAKKAKPAKVETEEEDEAEAKPAKKVAKASTPGAADKFRLAYLKALVKGKAPKPQELVTKLGLELSDNYVTGMAYDLRKTVDALRKAELLKED